ncbi:MAG: hypothetical protein EZS28_001099 [Streblomastix strix]|uniref:Uncharacterized protein n=1 Tax=Streblomastix strix TaxID=222440 RepID=A0A5J4XA25_9EUKA|nr:MAG: hypothetical protein EZS28_001099 [Streblomastix strix]
MMKQRKGGSASIAAIARAIEDKEIKIRQTQAMSQKEKELIQQTKIKQSNQFRAQRLIVAFQREVVSKGKQFRDAQISAMKSGRQREEQIEQAEQQEKEKRQQEKKQRLIDEKRRKQKEEKEQDKQVLQLKDKIKEQGDIEQGKEKVKSLSADQSERKTDKIETTSSQSRAHSQPSQLQPQNSYPSIPQAEKFKFSSEFVSQQQMLSKQLQKMQDQAYANNDFIQKKRKVFQIRKGIDENEYFRVKAQMAQAELLKKEHFAAIVERQSDVYFEREKERLLKLGFVRQDQQKQRLE